jgi:surface protein
VEVRRSSDNYSASIGFDSFGNFDTASLDRFIATGSGVLAGSYSNLAAAYSLRQVVPGYSGFVIQIESASLTQDISFNPDGTLDTGSISSFAGSGDAFVRIWYDQSGNNNHMSQSSATFQPKIYSGSQGSIILENGKPALQFDGTDDTLVSSFSSTQPLTSLLVAKSLTNATATRFILGDSDVRLVYTNASSDFLAYAGGSTPSFGAFNTNQNLFFTYVSGSSSRLGFNGGTISSTTNLGSSALGSLSIGGGTAYVNGTYQEVIVYTTDQISNRTYIENNINSYYGIYTPDSVSTEDAFVKTWYDQSGNNYHATQSVDANQPQIVSNGVIVTENGKPALQFDGSNDYLSLISTLSLLTSHSNFSVANNNNKSVAVLYGSTSPISNFNSDSGNFTYNAEGSYAQAGGFQYGQKLLSVLRNNTTTINIFQNTTFYSLSISSNNNFTIKEIARRADLGAYLWFGNIQEIVLYPSDQSSNRGLIEDNINGYYNIFTHSLDSGSGYVTRWYDQSGNDRHATQTVAANQPLILSSGSIVTEGGKSALSFDGVNDQFTLVPITGLVSASFFVIAKSQNSIRGRILSGNNFYWFIGGSANGFGYFINTTPSGTDTSYNNNQRLFTGIIGSGNFKFYINTLLDINSNGTISTFDFRNIFSNGSIQNPKGLLQETIIYPTNETSNRQPIEQDINTYFNIYTPEAYNLNSNSLSLFSSPTTVLGAANNVASASFTTGGPLGLITVSRTGSSNYTLWKNRVPNKVTTSPSVPQSTELYLNAANLNNSLFSASQNNIAYASVGAGLTDDEVYTYYELVDELQTELGRGPSNPGAFISTWDTRLTGSGTSNSSSIQFPVALAGTASIAWGDGTISLVSSSLQSDVTHSYATPGIYTIILSGGHEKINFFSRGGADKRKILDVSQWGSGSWLNDIGAFWNGIINLRPTANDAAVGGSTIRLMFNGIAGNPGIEKWDVSNTSNFNAMVGSSTFNRDISNWNMRSATDLSSMLAASPFNNADRPTINNWRFNTSSAVSINASSMFQSTPFNQPIGNWNVDSFTNMSFMFYTTPRFNQDLSNWNVSRVTNFSRAFGTSIFNNSGSAGINNWTTISCSNMSAMFSINSAFNQPIGNWNTSNVTDMGGMFWNAPAFNQPIGSWNTSKVTNFNYFGQGGMFQYATAFNQNIGAWDVSKVVGTGTAGFYRMFYAATAFNNSGSSTINNWRFNTTSSLTFAGMFSGDNTTNSCKFNQNIGDWNVEKVVDMNSMFLNNTGFNNSGSSDINNWRPISCSNFNSMFSSATAFNQPIGNWTLPTASNIAVTMSNMFYNADAFNQNIGAWNVEKVTNMSSMFNNADAFNQNIGSWNVEKVTNMFSMFFGNRDFNNSGSSDINNWRPISCSNFGGMFSRAIAFNQPIGNWPLSASSINMDSMFFSTTNFNQPIGSWNVSKVTNMSEMFSFAGPFNQPIGSWDVSNVTNMNNMFYAAGTFNQDIGNWNVSKVTQFGFFMYVGGYSYLHTIYDGWIQNRLQPQRFWRTSAKYSGSAAEGRALLSRPYVTQSVVNIQDSSSFINIVTQDAHNLTPNNKVFIHSVSGSISGSINGLRTVLSTGSATEFTLSGSVWNPADIYDMGTGEVITGYGWDMGDGGVVV